MRTAFSVLWVVLIIFGFSILRLEHRIVTLELACHGQCQFGDHACHERCDKDGHCPMGDK